MNPSVTILGARGSLPVSSQECLHYGGATLCVFIRLADQPVILDAGTGILSLATLLKPDETEIPLLLSHPHVDHLLGFPMCPALFDKRKKLHIYGTKRNGLQIEEQFRLLISPPLWPVSPEQVGSAITFHTIDGAFELGPVRVDVMEGLHPGGVTLFRLTGGGKSVVYLTDCSLTEDFFSKAAAFSQDCDLLLCDGQYAEDEWSVRKHFGHSTWTAAAQLAAAANAKYARIIHHDPFRTDRELDAAAKNLACIHPGCTFAYAGENIVL